MGIFDDELLRVPKQAPGPAKVDAGGSPRHDDGPTSPRSAAGLLGLQRAAGNAAVVQRLRGDEDLESVNQARSGGGQPLDTSTRVQMEQSLGADFSDVRVHNDGAADQSARSLGAHAYTVGSDVVFAQGRYDPGSETGQRTLAHELTHVVQQRSGPVEGNDTGGGVRVSDPSDRFEQAAEASADQVVAARSADLTSPAAASPGAPALQREGMEEEAEEVQALAVQREGEEEEAEEVQALAVQREGEEEEAEEVQALAVQREGMEDEQEEVPA